jgi:hypothetical protein
VDELGQRLAQPRLTRLFGERAIKPGAEGCVEAGLGKGKVVSSEAILLFGCLRS